MLKIFFNIFIIYLLFVIINCKIIKRQCPNCFNQQYHQQKQYQQQPIFGQQQQYPYQYQQQTFQNDPLFQCPCIRPKNSSKCFSYDTTIQATTIEEALYSFPDISDPSPVKKPMVEAERSTITDSNPSLMSTMAFSPQASATAATGPRIFSSTTQESHSCTNQACAGCKHYVIEGFAESLNTTINYNKRQQGNDNMCPYLQQKHQKMQQTQQQQQQSYQQNNEIINQVVDLLQKAGQKRRKKRDSNDINFDMNTLQVDDSKDDLLGVSTTISCDYQRGQQLISDSPWCGLCNICWTWRKLPPEYFPGYLNEITCDSDNGCLAGFGKCRQVLRPLSILKNTAQPGEPEQWEQKTINSVVACECQVEVGTPLHSFITR